MTADIGFLSFSNFKNISSISLIFLISTKKNFMFAEIFFSFFIICFILSIDDFELLDKESNTITSYPFSNNDNDV